MYQEQERVQQGVCQTWAIRSTVDGPMIGLFSLDPQDHREKGPCYQGKNAVEATTPTMKGNDDEAPLNCGGAGYWLSPEYTGKGIMADVLKFALSRLARQEFGYDRVHGLTTLEAPK